MEHVCVRFFVHEGMRRDGRPMHDWRFQKAREEGSGGGTALRAIAGYGRHGLSEDSFFELAGELPEIIEFLGERSAIERLIDAVGRSGERLMHASHPVHLSITVTPS